MALALAFFAGLIGNAHAEVRIGLLLPLTGPLSEYSKDVHNAVRLAMSETGRERFELHTADTQGRPEIAALQAEKLIRQDRVQVLLGPLLTSEVVAILPRLEIARVPMITPARALLPGDGNAWVFRTEPRFEDLHRDGLAKWVATLRSQGRGGRIAVVFDKSDRTSFSEGAVIVPRLVKTAGASTVAQASFYGRTTQFAPYLKDVSPLSQDAFVIHASPVDSFNILRELRGMGFRGAAYLIQPPLLQFEARELAVAADHTYFASSFWLDDADPRARNFQQKMQRPVGILAPAAGQLYDAVHTIATIVSGADPREVGALVRRELESGRTFRGLSGPFSFDKEHNIRREVRLIAIRGGRFQIVQN